MRERTVMRGMARLFWRDFCGLATPSTLWESGHFYFAPTQVVRQVAACNHIGYTCRRGDQGVSTQRNRTVLHHRNQVGNSSETRGPAPPHPRPPELLNQRARYELARLGSP